MTVKKLTNKQKEAVVIIYDSKTRTIKEIAEFLGVSSRTIGRVLEEAGLMKPVARLQAEAKTVMTLLYKHKITVQQLETLLNSVMVMPSIHETIRHSTFQVRHTRKSPKAHNGLQTMLGFDLPGITNGVVQ